MRLKISKVEVIPIRVGLSRIYRGSYYQMSRRCTLITRLYTEDGIVGEAYNADADEEQAEIASIINRELSSIVVGMDALNPLQCWEAMFRITYDELRNRWYAMQAIACIDTAIWDAVGKVSGMPLYRLWGGYTNRMPVIAIGGYYSESISDIEKEIEKYCQLGVLGVKFKIGGRSPKEDAERLKRAVSVAPSGFRFMVDANQGYTLDEALEFVKLTSDFVQLEWFEEPCIWVHDNWLRAFRYKSGVPTVAGQMEYSSSGIRRLIESESIDISNFDASWGGGPSEWLKVAGMALTFGIGLAHHEEPHLAAHLLASHPMSKYVEVFDPERDPIFWNMIENLPQITDGYIALPDGPGLGWKLDETFITKYRADI